MKHDLIGESRSGTFPSRSEKRLLEGVDSAHLELIDTTTFKSGIVVCTYAPK
jgi:hypothetical protein